MTRADLRPSFFYAVIFSCLAAHAHQEKPRQRPSALILSGRSIPGTAAFLYSHARRQSPQDRLRPRPLQEFAHCCQQLRLASSSLTGPDEDSRGGRPGGGGRGDSGQVQHPGSAKAIPTRAKAAREREAAAGLAPACRHRPACDGDQRQPQTRRPRLHQHLRRRRRGPTTTTCAFSIGPGSLGLGTAPAARAAMVAFTTKRAPLLATAMPPSRAPRTRRRSITRIALFSSIWHQQRACRPPSRGRPGQGVSETPCRVHA